MPDSRSFRWTSASRTDVGNVRKVNEDALLDMSSHGVWVVADGMGGHASTATIDLVNWSLTSRIACSRSIGACTRCRRVKIRHE